MLNVTILRTKKELDSWRKQQNCQINFVPTMGGLHDGHKRLIEIGKKLSLKEPSSVLVSIFVNPLQFGPKEDFTKYPRTLEKDCQIALEAGANAVWLPSLEDIFPGGTESHFNLQAPKRLTSTLCGANRDGHFDGVVTVVTRLLNLLKPNTLILGEKDWQQLIILRKLIDDLNLNISIKNVPTHRDKDGLASSTRNQYLSQYEREKALFLPKQLSQIAKDFYKGKHLNLEQIKSSLEDNDLKVEYLEIVDPEDLQPVKDMSKLCLIGAAVQLGHTRLIDHKFLMTRSPIVAIDGPAGAGKSTVTKAFANELGLMYLDTGAMYRAVTWLIQEKDIHPDDTENISLAIKDINLQLQTTNDGLQQVFVNEQEVSHEIRTPKITSQVSKIAVHSSVREAMVNQQKQIGLKGGLVAEGRDIGTTVFPNADLKVFLTASSKERAKRRALDLEKRGFTVPSLVELEKQIYERDQLDSSRKISPLIKAKDAKELVTDGMSIDEVVKCLINMFRLKVAEEVWPSFPN